MATQADRKAKTRARLLHAARKVFAAKGYAGAAVDDVAIEAGMTKGAVYAHFRTKEALFLALLREQGLANLAEVEENLEATSDHPDDRAAMLTRRFTSGVAERDWTSLGLEFILHASRDPALRRELREFYNRGRELDGELIARIWTDIGIEPAIDPEDFDRILSGLSLTLAIEQLLDPRADLSPVAKRTFSFLLRAVGHSARPKSRR